MEAAWQFTNGKWSRVHLLDNPLGSEGSMTRCGRFLPCEGVAWEPDVLQLVTGEEAYKHAVACPFCHGTAKNWQKRGHGGNT